jgi:flagellar protein FlaG
MNEVRLQQTAAQPSVSSASSTGNIKVSPQVSGKDLPEKDVQSEALAKAQEAPKLASDSLQVEVKKLNEFVQTVQRDLQFSVDEDLDRTVIKVVDSASGDLIRQIPEDVFLELARSLKEDGKVNLLDTLG